MQLAHKAGWQIVGDAQQPELAGDSRRDGVDRSHQRRRKHGSSAVRVSGGELIEVGPMPPVAGEHLESADIVALLDGSIEAPHDRRGDSNRIARRRRRPVSA